ncbi:hypothetical protein P154DRAFT_525055 [Amniculicola lignicola CBS 123094]|uniref:Uncharacterized protein n=1 Tax=Amniculicola lignicola CBS 123094 TaxID=1392246 RepID=A0A6A5W8S2_9PLEO|nr:hypothetical protein P154DRAFT_525055 [Amniculicola lignicola CBS 123094]
MHPTSTVVECNALGLWLIGARHSHDRRIKRRYHACSSRAVYKCRAWTRARGMAVIRDHFRWSRRAVLIWIIYVPMAEV